MEGMGRWRTDTKMLTCRGQQRGATGAAGQSTVCQRWHVSRVVCTTLANNAQLVLAGLCPFAYGGYGVAPLFTTPPAVYSTGQGLPTFGVTHGATHVDRALERSKAGRQMRHASRQVNLTMYLRQFLPT